MRRLLAPVWRLLPEGGLARHAGIISGGAGLQLLTQIGWLVLAVRFLGPDGYGLFASLTVITITASCFVGWGCDQLMVRAVAVDRALLPDWLGHCLIAIAATGLLLGAACFAGLELLPFLRIGAVPLLVILASDLLLGRVATLAVSVFTATEQSFRQSTATAVLGVTRLVAIGAAGLMPGELTIDHWAWWYGGANLVAAACNLALILRDHGMPRWRWIPRLLGDGFAFSAERALLTLVRDLDKVLVAGFVGTAAAGLYTASFRAMDALCMPVNSLGYASYPRLVRAVQEGRAATIALALKLARIGVAIGLAAGLGVLLFADLMPLVFGPAYEGMPTVMRLISATPALFAVFTIGADTLTAQGRQFHRLGLVLASLLLTLLLCWVGVTAGGLTGAALARVLSTAVTGALIWALIVTPRRHERAPA